jgi:hypothetical protein
MKMCFLGTVIFIVVLISCKKKEVLLTNEGVITGINPCEYACVIECPCACGNYLFHFTDMNDTSNIIIDNHAIFKLPSNTEFPVRVTVDWQSTTRCGVKAIKILKYKLV